MPLQFIFGNSGSGKSHLLYQTMVKEAKEHPQQNYIVIVPEQFTMQTQKDLVLMHPDHGIMNIDVLSFGRLAHRIFEEVGSDRRLILTETGKNLMVRRVAIEEKEHLKVLSGSMNRPGYVSEVKSVLSEFMQYEITDDMIGEMLEATAKKPLLNAKLADIRILYRAFLDYQRDRFMKPEELLDVLCRVADRSSLLRNSTVALDGFAGFTPAQLNVLEKLLQLCPMVYVTVTIDAGETFFGEIQEHELFAVSKKMIRSVSRAAERAAVRAGRNALGISAAEIKEVPKADAADEKEEIGASAAEIKEVPKTDEADKKKNPAKIQEQILPPVVLGWDRLWRFRPGSALHHLEQNLFRRKRRVYTGKTEEISMHVSSSPAEEIHFAARTICQLVREQGYRYHEIAVITGNLDSYDKYAKKIFPMYDIPIFLDQTRHILLNPCLEFVQGALQIAEQDFSAESVLRFLRTGMAGLAPEVTDRLENYMLASGIRGHGMWEREWTYCPGRMTLEEVEFCNEARVQALTVLEPFARKMREKEASLRVYAEALCELLEVCQVQQKLKNREIELEQAGFREEASEYAQIYGILIRLIDEMVDLMGEEMVSTREFSEILDAGFSEAKVGILPPGIDMVQVGDIERSRLAHIRALFFLGLNDGWVPAKGKNSGIVSDMEREMLQNTGVELAPSARENGYIQRFYLYQNLTKPGDRLYLSWCSSSGDGTAMRPSYLVAVIRKLFPQILVTKEADAGASIRQVTSRENGMLYLTGGLQRIRDGREDKPWQELYRMYLRDGQYKERVQLLVQAAFSHSSQERLSYLTSRELYGESMKNSVTRLEQFASCAFAHFAAYGLRLQERELYGIRPTDLGVIFHRVMELFSRRVQGCGCDWSEIPIKEQQTMMERCVEEVSEEYGAGMLHGSAREEYTIFRLKRIMNRTIWALHQQLCAGRFRPTGFEVSFEDVKDLEAVNVRFGENGRLRLQGRIDRIDTVETEDAVYVKIIDYKSGMAQFDPVSLYYGLQLQLIVYLNAALEMERKLHPDKEVIPAGIFYCRMQDPVLEKEAEDSPQKQQERLLKKLRPDGVLNSDPQILRLFDQGINGDSLVIPAGLKKNGELKAASSTASTEQFAHLSGFVSEQLARMGEQILAGVVDVRPFADKDGSACDYCAYLEVCGFDRKIPGLCEKRTADISKSEAWERIAQETTEHS